MLTPEEIKKELSAAFPPSDLEWMPSSCEIYQKGNSQQFIAYMTLTPYVDARAIQDRLDEVMGIDGWRDEYRETPEGMICRLSLLIDGKWITKEDGAPARDGHPVKGVVSDALKRAAVKFGIGRYLYSLPRFPYQAAAIPDQSWHDVKADVGRYDGLYRSAMRGTKNYFRIPWMIPKLPGWALPFPDVAGIMDAINNATSLDELRGAYEQGIIAARINDDASMRDSVVKAKDAVKARLEAKQEDERLKEEQRLKDSARQDADEMLQVIGLLPTAATLQPWAGKIIDRFSEYPDLLEELMSAYEAMMEKLKPAPKTTQRRQAPKRPASKKPTTTKAK